MKDELVLKIYDVANGWVIVDSSENKYVALSSEDLQDTVMNIVNN